MKQNIMIFLIALLLLVNHSFAQQREQFPGYQRVINMAVVPLFAIPLVHESGHGLFAWVVGADSISIHPFSILPFEKHSLNPDVGMYDLKSGAIYAGGAVTTRLTAQLIHVLLNSTKSPRWVEGVGGGLSTMMRVDLPVQYLWGLVYAVFSPSKGLPDFSGMTGHLFDTPFLNTIFQVVAGAIITADIYYSWRAINQDFNRAIGRTP